MNGKGSSPRPFSVDRKTFENNWDEIFNKKEEIPWDNYSDLPSVEHYKEEKDEL